MNHLLDFQPGHPLTLGGDHYRIQRKLRGYPTSTVWLAEHVVRGASRRRFVAIETFDRLNSRTFALESRSDPRSPTTSLNYIRNIVPAQNDGLPGALACHRAHAVFLPNTASVLYVVKDPPGPTLLELQRAQPNIKFTLPVTKRIIKTVLLALQYIHSTGRTHAGVAHYNIVVALQGSNESLSANIADFLRSHPPEMHAPPSNNVDKNEPSTTKDSAPLNAKNGSPPPPSASSSKAKGSRASSKTKVSMPSTTKTSAPPLKTSPGLSPGTLLKSQPLPAFGLSPTLDNLEVRLTRCEHATRDKRLLEIHAERGNKPPTLQEYTHSALKYAAPEALCGTPQRWSPPVNIWAVGHLTHICLTGYALYSNPHGSPRPSSQPPEWNEVVWLTRPRTRMVEGRVRAHRPEGTSEEDIQATIAFIERCFEMDPAKRPTATELLEDEWFRT